MTSPTLRPLSTGELLDLTFSLYRSHFALFVGIIAVTQLALVAVQLLGLALMPRPSGPFDIAGSLLWLPVVVLVTLAVTAASQGATVVAVSHVYLGRPISVAASLAHIQGRIASLALTMIGIGLMVAAGLLLLVVPGVILSLMWAIVIPVAVLEHRSLFDAASRSAALTKGDRLRVLVVYTLFALLVWIVSIVINLPLTVAAVLSGGVGAPGTTTVWVQVVGIVSSFATQCLVAPLMTIAFSLLYYDERVRKEAFDLELMMAAIDGQWEPVPEPGP
jgi:hypothetical protein